MIFPIREYRTGTDLCINSVRSKGNKCVLFAILAIVVQSHKELIGSGRRGYINARVGVILVVPETGGHVFCVNEQLGSLNGSSISILERELHDCLTVVKRCFGGADVVSVYGLYNNAAGGVVGNVL